MALTWNNGVPTNPQFTGSQVQGEGLPGSNPYGYQPGSPMLQQPQQQAPQQQQPQQQAPQQQQQAQGGGGSNTWTPYGGTTTTPGAAFNGAPPVPPPTQDLINSFMPPVFTAPYYNAAGVLGNLGTSMGQNVVPGATNFLQNLFDPNLNQFEQSFLGAGMGNASRALEQGMMRQEAQFENTPFHSGLAKSQGDVMEQVSRDLISQAGQMGMQRQGLATQASQFPFQFTAEAAGQIPGLSERMYNLYNNAMGQQLQLPLSTYTQIPVPAPVITQGGGGMFK